ncbi:MAG TPA: transposase, partial [Longimicrobiaceae bacterium]|nr:transposase [Longimicrobiaceae bacterium]
DPTDAQWAVVRSVLPAAKNGRTGRPRTHELREVWNAIFYQAHNGCTWRALPHGFPPWPTVWQHFRRWRDSGTLERVHDVLRERVRIKAGREPSPSAAVLDSQSVRTAGKRGAAGATMRASTSPGASASCS